MLRIATALAATLLAVALAITYQVTATTGHDGEHARENVSATQTTTPPEP